MVSKIMCDIDSYVAKYTEEGVDSLWVPLRANPNGYIVSDGGKIVRLPWIEQYVRHNKIISRPHPDRLLKGTIDQDGYCIVSILDLSGTVRSARLHRLVLETFVDNLENKRTVNHINGVKTDNRLANLEWATDHEQQVHAVQTGLKDTGVHVKCLDNQIIYKSLEDAAADLGLTSDSIRYWTRKCMRHPSGYTFIFVDTFKGDELSYLNSTIEHHDANYKPRQSARTSSILCLDCNLKFESVGEAARWINADATSLIYSIDVMKCCKGHVFVRTTEFNYSDIQKYIDYCYTRSRDFKHLASRPVYSLE